MNQVAIELGRSLTPKQKRMLVDLCRLSVETNGADFSCFELIFQATQNSRVYDTNDLSTAQTMINRYQDGLLV
jgi:hypothetical protein